MTYQSNQYSTHDKTLLKTYINRFDTGNIKTISFIECLNNIRKYVAVL